jgi:N6-adenosine-specific RNA methylase IME4
LNFGERKDYGDTFTEALKITNFELGTLRDAKWIAGQYEMSIRIDNLTFLHHRIALGSTSPRKALKWAAKPHKKGDRRTCKELRAYIYDEKKKERGIEELPAGQYQIIYADPPWKYGDTRKGLTGYSAAEDHYPCMSIQELCDMRDDNGKGVDDLAADDAVLFLWVTSPLLYEAAPIIDAWGFKYKASIVWDKISHNVGHYVSVRHEFLLICTRGSFLPQTKTLHDSVVSIKREKHSAKPEYFRELIDKMYPNGKRLELFLRGKAPKRWNGWGNESTN